MSGNDISLHEELLAIADILDAQHGLGLSAAPEPQQTRVRRALDAVAKIICPQSTKISHAFGSLGAEVAIMLIDIAICAALSLLLPPAKLCQLIIHHGIKNFCDDPTIILDHPKH